MRLFGLFLAACAFAFLAGCGSVGEPLYPALNIPTRIVDLAAIERGDKLDIRFTIPARTTEGLTIRQVASVEVRVGPNDQSGFELNQWASTAKRVEVSPISPPGQGQAVEIDIRDSIGKDLIVAVRLANARGRNSEWSNLVSVTIEPPLAKATDFKVEPVPQGAWLTWTAPPGITDFRVYKKTPEQNSPALFATTKDPNFLDTSVEFGKTYEYYVECFRDKTASEIVGPASITPEDIFPPAVPTGLTSTNGIDAIELSWERNAEPRFKEYRVYRSVDDGPFTPIGQPLDVPSYSDHDIQSGKHYRYRLTAVGQNGKESNPSNPIEVVAP